MLKLSASEAKQAGHDNILKFLAVAAPSFLIAAYPSRDTVKELVSYVGSPGFSEFEMKGPEDFHVTIRHWKCCTALKDVVIDWLEKQKACFSPIVCQPESLDIFGEEGSLVVKLGCTQINDLFDLVDQGIQELGVDPSTHPKYQPHLTVGEGFTSAQSFLPPNFPIVLDRLQFQNSNEEVFWEQKVPC